MFLASNPRKQDEPISPISKRWSLETKNRTDTPQDLGDRAIICDPLSRSIVKWATQGLGFGCPCGCASGKFRIPPNLVGIPFGFPLEPETTVIPASKPIDHLPAGTRVFLSVEVCFPHDVFLLFLFCFRILTRCLFFSSLVSWLFSWLVGWPASPDSLGP